MSNALWKIGHPLYFTTTSMQLRTPFSTFAITAMFYVCTDLSCFLSCLVISKSGFLSTSISFSNFFPHRGPDAFFSKALHLIFCLVKIHSPKKVLHKLLYVHNMFAISCFLPKKYFLFVRALRRRYGTAR